MLKEKQLFIFFTFTIFKSKFIQYQKYDCNKEDKTKKTEYIVSTKNVCLTAEWLKLKMPIINYAYKCLIQAGGTFTKFFMIKIQRQTQMNKSQSLQNTFVLNLGLLCPHSYYWYTG